jgi:hypothetical protein
LTQGSVAIAGFALVPDAEDPDDIQTSVEAPLQFSDYLTPEVVKWAKLVKDSGARVD